MANPEPPEMLAFHVRAASRAGGESVRLLRILTASLWPGGSTDRTDPIARGWLQMWGPVQVTVDPPHCDCAAGYCTICN